MEGQGSPNAHKKDGGNYWSFWSRLRGDKGEKWIIELCLGIVLMALHFFTLLF